MICKPFRKNFPVLHPSVRAAENAAVIGAVRCEKGVNLWYSVTVRGDTDTIFIGEDTNIQDGSVLHCDGGAPLSIGCRCTVGHGAIVHGCAVGDETLIGMGATLLSGCQVGSHCIIGANALVTGNMVIPDGWMAVGVPAKAVRPLKPQEISHALHSAREYCQLAEELLPLVGTSGPVRL